MASIIGTSILWGEIPEADLPKLPDGWRYQIEKRCWVLAISPKGDEYYVAPTKLYPRRVRPTGTFFVDTQEGVINIPEKDHGKELD